MKEALLPIVFGLKFASCRVCGQPHDSPPFDLNLYISSPSESEVPNYSL